MRELMNDKKIMEDAAATLSSYIKIDTTNLPGNEMPAALWLQDQLKGRSITQDIKIYEPLPGRGLLVARIPGTEKLKPLMLNHHMDVVAADPAQWTYPPFSGAVADGFVWGRGTIDTKGLGIIFLIALDQLLTEGARFRRPIVFTAVPDEELGGKNGMSWLVENHLKEIDPEWVWDEGSGGLKGVFGKDLMYAIAVAEKTVYQVKLTATGDPGHGSMPHANNANVTLLAALQRIADKPRKLRADAAALLMFKALAPTQKFPASFLLKHLSCSLALAIAGRSLAKDKLINALFRDTLSINVINAGYQINVIPERAEAMIDCRLLPGTDVEEFQRALDSIIRDERVKVELLHSSAPSGIAPVDGKFYRTVSEIATQHVPGARVFPLLMAGATDGRFWRERGYAAYGFAPFILEREDIGRVHGIDERISLHNLSLGIKMAKDIIKALCG
jgi:acetylornithine deacetylase/succinyl-diaminopimelate desuccinylase-like protein